MKDIHRKLHVQRELFLVGLSDGRLVAAVMAGYEGHRGWINYLAVALEYREQGFGRRMMDAAEARLRGMGCPKINLQDQEVERRGHRLLSLHRLRRGRVGEHGQATGGGLTSASVYSLDPTEPLPEHGDSDDTRDQGRQEGAGIGRQQEHGDQQLMQKNRASAQ